MTEDRAAVDGRFAFSRLTALLVVAASAWATAGPAHALAIPESPAQRAGLTEMQYVDRTSLSERPGELVTPVAAVASSGRPLADSARIVAALRAKDGKTITFRQPTIVDFGHYVVGFYYRPGATADPVSAFPDFFRTQNPGSPGQLALANGDWYPARYVKLPAGVPIDVVGFRFNSDLATPPATMAVPNGRMPGAFFASDPLLTRIWFSAASTMQLSMMTTTANSPYEFFDGPERDRTLWLWYDASANPTAYYAFGPLARPVAYASYAIPGNGEPCAFSVSGSFCGGLPDDLGWAERDLASMYEFYGDPQIVSSHYSDVLAHENGVVAAHLDPRGLYRTGYLPVPPNPMNPIKLNDHSMSDEMWVYAGLLGSQQLARASGDVNGATLFAERAAALKQAVNRYLWNASKGAFVYYVGSQHVDEAGNAMAVIYGLATPDQARRILAYLHSHNDRLYDWSKTKRWGAVNPAGSTDFDRPFLPGDPDLDVADWSSPYSPLWGWSWGMGSNPNDFSSANYNYNYALSPWAEAFEVQADFTMGEDGAALSLIRRAWGTMLRWGPSTFFEESRYDGTPAYRLGQEHNSVDHRWASLVGALLQEYVLGVTPTSPGFASWQIQPHGGNLKWAQGRVPTPRGQLSAWWQRYGRRGRSGYTMVVESPPGTIGTLELPISDSGALTFDGREIWPARRAGAGPKTAWDPALRRFVLSGVAPGKHVIKWSARRRRSPSRPALRALQGGSRPGSSMG